MPLVSHLLVLLLTLLVVAVYYASYHRHDSPSLKCDVHDARHSPISVIIPALHEGAILSSTIERLFLTADPKNEPTVVVVHAGPETDPDPLIAAHPTLHLVRYPGQPSRGAQLNFGVAHAIKVAPKTSLFLFLHADTLLPPAWDNAIRATLLPPSSSSSLHPPALGTFTLSLPPPVSPALRLMLWGANRRARWGGMPYGDQGYFLRRHTFDVVGGFPPVPIMEDVELLRRVVRLGKVAVIDEAVETSVRRWKQKGVFWNTILNQVLITAWICGVSHETIYRVYYGKRARSRAV